MTELGYDAQNRPVFATEKRICVGCRALQPLTQFRRIRGALLNKCRACESKERRWRKRGRRWDE
jgi:hypothetical protein